MSEPTTKRFRLRLTQSTERHIDVPTLQRDAIERSVVRCVAGDIPSALSMTDDPELRRPRCMLIIHSGTMPLSSLRFLRYHQCDNRNALPRSRERSCASDRVKKATIDKDNTTVIDGVGTKADIDTRIGRMRQQIEATTSEYDSETLQGWLAKLAGGVAVIRVGNANQVKVKEKDRVDDAQHADVLRSRGHLLPGGGVSSLRALKAPDGIKAANDDQQSGFDIVCRALRGLPRQNAQNAGEDGASIVGKLVEAEDYNWSSNAPTGGHQDRIQAGMIDPAKFVRSMLQDGASVASLLITTEPPVAEVSKEDKPTPVPAQDY
eukprot:TRINITY_DN9239_c0_g1_i1.p1 TRINITY_DN9239_c0_g1~~TRINITY_DN9239_c0_g1_i1.p1  ORF type:complete len:320 (+),score=32.58 TRINITY_DN9239_c0_g1_i1:802-1761(+)